MVKLLRNINKLSFPDTKLKQLSKELAPYSSISALAEVKKVNHGIYQLLIWELFVIEYIKKRTYHSL